MFLEMSTGFCYGDLLHKNNSILWLAFYYCTCKLKTGRCVYTWYEKQVFYFLTNVLFQIGFFGLFGKQKVSVPL